MKTIVIACGGSGIKTAIRLNEMLASNPAKCKEMWRNMYYIAADTDESDLDMFKNALETHAATIGEPPFYRPIPLSGGHSRLSDVTKTMKAEDEDGLKRLQQNWWYKNGKPFAAPKVNDLGDGASRCPPASYLLAWNSMDTIGDVVKETFNKIRENSQLQHSRRKSSTQDRVQLLVIAGLSGGTGRGCWNLLAFKFREHYMLHNQGRALPTIGVFFDATAYPVVLEEAGSRYYRLKVNALTGFSELSCWMALKQDEDLEYSYNLPSLKTPSDRDTDVLTSVVKVLDDNDNSTLVDDYYDRNDLAPVNKAFIICGNSKDSILERGIQYHQMAAAGLYSLLSTKVFTSTMSNETSPFQSFATRTFEVDNLKLKSYLTNRVHQFAVEKMATGEDFDVSAAVEAFFKKLPVRLASKPTNIVDSWLKTIPSPLKTAVEAFEKDFDETQTEYENENIKKRSDYETMKTTAAECLLPLNVETTDLGHHFNPVFNNLYKEVLAKANDPTCPVVKGDDPKNVKENAFNFVRSQVWSVYKGGENENPSLARAAGFINKLMDELLKIEKLLPQELPIDTHQQKQTVDGYWESEFNKRTSGFWIFGGRISQKEGLSLWADIVSPGIKSANWPLIRKSYLDQLNVVRANLVTIGNVIKNIQTVFDNVASTLEREARDAAGVGADKNKTHIFEKVFLPKTQIDSSIPELSDRSRFYRRTLIPICSQEEVESWLLDDFKNMLDANEVNKTVAEIFADLLTPSSLTNQTHNTVLTTRVYSSIKANSSLPEDFLEKHFSFIRVLANNIRCWQDHLNALRGNSKMLGQFKDRFENLFGCYPVEKQGKYELPFAGELVKSYILKSMVGKFDPWWVLTKQQKDTKTAQVFLPFDLNDATAVDKLQKELKEWHERPVNVYDASHDKTIGNPFQILCFTSEELVPPDNGEHAFDRITNFVYMRDSVVKKWLLKAEMDDVKESSIYATEDDNPGIGYPNPEYIRNDTLRSIRWKPWKPEPKKDTATDAKDRIADLLVYAMLGNHDENGTSAEMAEIKEKFALSMPLIKFEEHGKTFSLTRKTCVNDGTGKAVANNDCDWRVTNKGLTLAQNINGIFDYFAGITNDGVGRGALRDKSKEVTELIEAELNEFKGKIKTELNRDFKKVVNEFVKWLVETRDTKDADKKPNWNRLIKAVEKLQ